MWRHLEDHPLKKIPLMGYPEAGDLQCGNSQKLKDKRRNHEGTDHDPFRQNACRRCADARKTNGEKIMKTPKRLELVASGEPSDVIELNTVSNRLLAKDVLVSMEAAPLNPSDFMLVRGIYGLRPAFPFSVGAEGVGRNHPRGLEG